MPAIFSCFSKLRRSSKNPKGPDLHANDAAVIQPSADAALGGLKPLGPRTREDSHVRLRATLPKKVASDPDFSQRDAFPTGAASGIQAVEVPQVSLQIIETENTGPPIERSATLVSERGSESLKDDHETGHDGTADLRQVPALSNGKTTAPVAVKPAVTNERRPIDEALHKFLCEHWTDQCRATAEQLRSQLDSASPEHILESIVHFASETDPTPNGERALDRMWLSLRQITDKQKAEEIGRRLPALFMRRLSVLPENRPWFLLSLLSFNLVWAPEENPLVKGFCLALPDNLFEFFLHAPLASECWLQMVKWNEALLEEADGTHFVNIYWIPYRINSANDGQLEICQTAQFSANEQAKLVHNQEQLMMSRLLVDDFGTRPSKESPSFGEEDANTARFHDWIKNKLDPHEKREEFFRRLVRYWLAPADKVQSTLDFKNLGIRELPERIDIVQRFSLKSDGKMVNPDLLRAPNLDKARTSARKNHPARTIDLRGNPLERLPSWAVNLHPECEVMFDDEVAHRLFKKAENG